MPRWAKIAKAESDIPKFLRYREKRTFQSRLARSKARFTRAKAHLARSKPKLTRGTIRWTRTNPKRARGTDRLTTANAKLARASARRAALTAWLPCAAMRHAFATAPLHAAKPTLHTAKERAALAEGRGAVAFVGAARSSVSRATILRSNGRNLRATRGYMSGMKRHKAPAHVTVKITARAHAEFTKANKELERRTGAAPGIEALITLMLRAENAAEDIANIYCYKVLRWSPELIDHYRTR